MCFNQTASFIFSLVGIAGAIYCWKTTKNFRLTTGVVYFVLMEILQIFQYFWIDQCDNPINKFLTIVGLLHISFQPFFTHFMISGLALTPKAKAVYAFILRLAFIVGFYFFWRWPLSYVPYFQSKNTEGFLLGYNEDGSFRGEDSVCGRSTEWVRGSEICTFQATRHLGWSIPLAANSYFVPGVFIHFFMMFAPFFALKNMWAYGIFLMISGPILSKLITDDLMEQASIWCLFSVFQVVAMVFGIRFFFHNQKVHEEFKKKVESGEFEKKKE